MEIVQVDKLVCVDNADLDIWEIEGMVDGPSPYIEDVVDEFEGNLGQGFMSANELGEVDIGPGDRSRPTYVSTNLPTDFEEFVDLLKDYRDCFAWEYHKILGLS
jgi:hypothetical protein